MSSWNLMFAAVRFQKYQVSNTGSFGWTQVSLVSNTLCSTSFSAGVMWQQWTRQERDQKRRREGARVVGLSTSVGGYVCIHLWGQEWSFFPDGVILVKMEIIWWYTLYTIFMVMMRRGTLGMISWLKLFEIWPELLKSHIFWWFKPMVIPHDFG